MKKNEFVEAIFEIAFGDDAINKGYSHEEVVEKIREFSDKELSAQEADEASRSVNNVLAELLLYSFGPIEWDYNRLTHEEKDIVGSHETMEDLKKFFNENLQQSPL